LHSDIALARKERSKCSGANAENEQRIFGNEGLKNQGIFGDVEKCIALPKLRLLWNSTISGLLAAFRGVTSFWLLQKPI
jgi:hypothetical protein